MPHQCVRCNTFYEDGSKAILAGCSCGGKLFFYVKKEKLEKAEPDYIIEDVGELPALIKTLDGDASE